MSALNAIEMSAFSRRIERPFSLRARRSHVYAPRGKRADRDESSRTRPVESVAWRDRGRATPEGGGSAFALDDTTSATVVAAHARARRSGADSSLAWPAFQSTCAGRATATRAGG